MGVNRQHRASDDRTVVVVVDENVDGANSAVAGRDFHCASAYEDCDGDEVVVVDRASSFA